uniref:Glycosyltransferase family 25 n=1 Tax=Mimiviridae sp. ChoanoV1 TaxID=2596887 RepID=A0A5B8IGR9_9VIRU|nr:glycosyltransferase family 25 [Mimiviridae sp. ChoanoV1]
MTEINIPIYYINLEKSTDRNHNMISQLTNYNYTRFPAIDDNHIIFKKYNDLIKSKYCKDSKKLACLLSHLYAIKKAYDTNLENIIIFEDDVDLTIFNQVYRKTTILFSKLRNTEIFQLFSSNINFYNKPNKLIRIEHKYGMWGACGYIINFKGMKKIMDLYNYKYDKFDIINYNNYYLSDVLLYDICRTVTFNVPFINLKSPSIYKSTLENDTNPNGIHLQKNIDYINSIKDDIIKTIEESEIS